MAEAPDPEENRPSADAVDIRQLSFQNVLDTILKLKDVKVGGIPEELFVDLTEDEKETWNCNICYQITNEAHECENHHLFCHTCCFAWTLTYGENSQHCPVCRNRQARYLRASTVQDALDKKRVRCPETQCEKVFPLKIFLMHSHGKKRFSNLHVDLESLRPPRLPGARLLVLGGAADGENRGTIAGQLRQGRMMIHQMMALLHLEMQLRQQALFSYSQATTQEARIQRLDEVLALNEQLNEVGSILSNMLQVPVVRARSRTPPRRSSPPAALSSFPDTAPAEPDPPMPAAPPRTRIYGTRGLMPTMAPEPGRSDDSESGDEEDDDDHVPSIRRRAIARRDYITRLNDVQQRREQELPRPRRRSEIRQELYQSMSGEGADVTPRDVTPLLRRRRASPARVAHAPVPPASTSEPRSTGRASAPRGVNTGTSAASSGLGTSLSSTSENPTPGTSLRSSGLGGSLQDSGAGHRPNSTARAANQTPSPRQPSTTVTSTPTLPPIAPHNNLVRSSAEQATPRATDTNPGPSERSNLETRPAEAVTRPSASAAVDESAAEEESDVDEPARPVVPQGSSALQRAMRELEGHRAAARGRGGDHVTTRARDTEHVTASEDTSVSSRQDNGSSPETERNARSRNADVTGVRQSASGRQAGSVTLAVNRQTGAASTEAATQRQARSNGTSTSSRSVRGSSGTRRRSVTLSSEPMTADATPTVTQSHILSSYVAATTAAAVGGAPSREGAGVRGGAPSREPVRAPRAARQEPEKRLARRGSVTNRLPVGDVTRGSVSGPAHGAIPKRRPVAAPRRGSEAKPKPDEARPRRRSEIRSELMRFGERS